jgi:hypothetical protein
MSEAIDKPAEADPTVYRLRANAFVPSAMSSTFS